MGEQERTFTSNNTLLDPHVPRFSFPSSDTLTSQIVDPFPLGSTIKITRDDAGVSPCRLALQNESGRGGRQYERTRGD